MAETREVGAEDDSGGRVDVGADVDLAGLRVAAEAANRYNAGFGWRYVEGVIHVTAPSVITVDPDMDDDDCRDLQVVVPEAEEVDARHIAAADPPTILALIARVETAEAAVIRVRCAVDRESRVVYRNGERTPTLYVLRDAISHALEADQ